MNKIITKQKEKMSSGIDEKKLNEFMDQVKKVEKGHKLDLSSDQDLSIAVMNLISIEEHLFFTAKKTGNNAYFDLLFDIREMRKELLKKLIKEYDGEVWCISKHLLSASMRLLEVGTKAMATQSKEAEDFFEKSYQLYNLFWALNLKIIGKDKAGQLTKTQEKLLQEVATENQWESETATKKRPIVEKKTTGGMWKKLGQALNKALDCCRE